MAQDKANSSSKKSAKHTISTLKTSYSNQLLPGVKSITDFLASMPIIGVIVAEFIGTFIITISFLEMQGNPLFFGFALIGATLIVGGVSGAHLNPAITIGAFATRKISAINAFFFIASQILGAIAAWWIINEFAKGTAADPSAENLVFHAANIADGKEWVLFWAELLGSTILALGVATSIRLRKNKIVAAFATGTAAMIALYITLSITTVLLTEQNTGFSFLNPVIAIAANGISWSNWPIALYIVAPIVGSLIGFVLQDYLNSQSEESDNNCNC